MTTTRTKLMLMAAALAPLPLSAQQPAPAQVPAAVIVPAQSAAVRRAEALAPLACIPADADGAVVLTNVFSRFGVNPKSVPEEIAGLQSIGIGFSKGWGQATKDAYSIIYLAIIQEAKSRLLQGWAAIAQDQLRSALTEAAAEMSAKDQQTVLDTLAQLKLHPAYGVASYVDDNAAKKCLASLTEEIKDACESDSEMQLVTVGEFVGFKRSLADLKPHGGKEEFDIARAAEEELSKRTIHVLFSVQGSKLVAVVCEDPSEIYVPATPEQSILNTKAFAAVDGHLADDIIFAAYASPDAADAGRGSWNTLLDAATPVISAFEKMAVADASHAEAFQAAANGVHTVVDQLRSLTPAIQNPSFVQVWATPGEYHAELSTDACGCEFIPGKLALTEQANNSDTILTIESTPLKFNMQWDLTKLGQAGMDIYNGALASLKPELQAAANHEMQEAMEILPDVSAVCQAVGTMLSGMGGTAGIVVDGKGVAPEGLLPGVETSIPRVALYSGVTDRAQISKGWDDLVSVAGDIMEKSGVSRAFLAMLPIIPERVGQTGMSYSVQLSGLTPDFGLNATVSDTAFAAGSSATLNRELVQTATGTIDFAGVTFTLNTKPLATTARSIADAMLKLAGPFETKREYWNDDVVAVEEADCQAEPAAASGQEETAGCGCGHCKIDQNGECICSEEADGEAQPEEEDAIVPCNCADEEDDDSYCMYNFGKDEKGEYLEVTRLKPGQMKAYRADVIAKRLEDFASEVKCIKGTISVKDGVETIHVDVQMNNQK